MSHNDEGFFREVDEDYRRDQAIKFFKAYGVYLIAGAFVVLAVVAGYKFDQSRKESRAAAGGDALTNAMLLNDAGKDQDSQKALAALAGSGSGAYRILARLHAAAEFVAKNKLDEARGDYSGVAGDDFAPQGLREFAKVQVAALSVDKESYDTLAHDLENLRSGTSRWRFSAKEIFRTLGLQGRENRGCGAFVWRDRERWRSAAGDAAARRGRACSASRKTEDCPGRANGEKGRG